MFTKVDEDGTYMELFQCDNCAKLHVQMGLDGDSDESFQVGLDRNEAEQLLLALQSWLMEQ